MTTRPFVYLSTLLVLCGGLRPAAWSAEEVAGPEETVAGPLRFVRVKVPTDQVRLEEIYRDPAISRIRHLPLDPPEFERLLARAQKTGRADRAPGTAIVSAHYQARLEADTLVEGRADLEVIHAAEGPILLALNPCRLAVRQPIWAGEAETAARVGAGPDGKLVLLVEKSGRVQFAWSLRGNREPGGALQFTWEAPPSPSNCLVLSLPTKYTPLAEQAVVEQQGPDDDGFRQWRIQMGGRRRSTIRVVPGDDPLERLPSTQLRQATDYRFSLGGLDASVRLELDVSGEPLKQMELALDPGLRPVKALYGETPLEWTWSGPAPQGQATRWDLEFPQPIRGPERIVRLQLVAPLELDRNWKLPAVRPQGLFWQEGEATLSVSPPLVLERLMLTQGRQSSKIEPLPGPRSGETVRVQYFDPQGGAEIVLTHPEPMLELDSGTHLEFSGREVIARIGVAASGTLGTQFLLEADVAPRWIVDSVVATPAELLADSSFDPGKTTSKLSIRFAKPLPQPAPGVPPVRLRIAARRVPSALGKALGIADLVPLRFRRAVERRRLVGLEARAPYELKLIGAEAITRVEPQTLDAASLSLVAPLGAGVLLENDAKAAGLRVALRARKPGYSATIRVEASLTDHALKESYWLRCAPEAGRRVDRVLVRLSRPRTAPLHWSLGNEIEDLRAVRRSGPAGPSDSGSAPQAETWDVRLRPPRSAPLELHATRTTPLTGQEDVVSLAALPEAKDQQASVTVRSLGDAAVEIENSRLAPLAPAAVPADQYNTIRGSFRYDPVQDVDPTAQPPLVISLPQAEDVSPSVLAWSCQLESQYEPSGAARHSATYRLESAGRARVRLTLPEAASRRDVRGVWVDDEAVAFRPAATEAADALDVVLPPGKRFVVLAICFSTTGSPLRGGDSITTPLPEIDVPLLAREWTVWLPPGFYAQQSEIAAAGARPASWTQRLFGPLGRPPDLAPFDPFSRQHWRRLIDGGSFRRAAESQASDLVRRLGERASAGRFAQPSESLAWGPLLGDEAIRRVLAAAGNRGAQRELLVDRRALSRSRLTPHTRVQLPAVETPAGRGRALLEQEDLALLIHADALVLTTAVEAAVRHAELTPVENDELNPLESRRFWWVRPGPLADRIERAAAREPDDHFLTVPLWQQQPPQPPLPWNDSRSGRVEPIDTRAWTAYRREIPDRLSARLSLLHRDTVRTFPWVAFLAVIGLAWWTAMRRPAALTVALGLFGAAALLLPETYAPIASGALLGTLFVVAVRLIRPITQGQSSGERSPGAPDRSSAPKATTALGLLLLVHATLICPAGSARGAEPKPAPVPVWWPAHGVLIPVDDEGQPTGEKYQVPVDFYNELVRLADAATPETQGWLLGPATYTGELVWQAAPDRLTLSELKATFQLQVLSPSARVVIPFGEGGPDLAADRVLLDGQPIQYELREDALVLPVLEKGAYQLEFSPNPSPRSEETSSGVDVAIPPLATSRLELTVPPDAPAIEALSSVGWTGSQRSIDSPRLVAELGPADRLALRWPRDAGPGSAGRLVDVEELLWLKVEPESVLLTARYLLSVIDEPVDELRLTADPRLRLRPVEGARIETTPGQRQTFRLVLAEPITDRRTIEASFVVPEATGVGNLRMPHLELLGARTTRRWMAVSVHPSLHAEEQAPDTLKTVAVSDFVSAWGEAAAPPRSAHRLEPGEPPWSMATRPLEPEITVDQTQAWSFGPGEARLRFEARLAADGGYRFQYRLSAPRALEIERVSLIEADAERADRWRVAPDGTVTIFLKRATTGEQTLSLQGRLPIPLRGRPPLPLVRFEGANVQSSRIQLLRKPEVLVDLSQMTAGLVEDEEPWIDSELASLGRLVKSFREEGGGPVVGSLKLKLEPNQTQVRAKQVTSLRSDGDAWEVEEAFRIEVTRGVLDEIRLTLPEACQGPFVVAPPVRWEEQTKAGQRRLIIRPEAAITGEYQFTVSSPLDFPPSERVGVPNVALEQVDLEEHLLVLPTQSGLRPVVWETRGVSRAELPDDFAALPVGPEAFVGYRVEEESFQAILRPVGREPAVQVADVRLAWEADGACRGLALFDLEPAGMSACSLRLPDGCQLVHVATEGIPSMAVRKGRNRWRVPLSGATLPQRIEVLFAGSTPELAPSGAVRLDGPTLEGLPARQTLWTVTGPPDYGPGRPEGLRAVGRLEQELVRLQNTEALIASGARISREMPEESDRWFRTWARRWAASCRQVEHERARTRPTEAPAPPEDRLPWDRLPAPVADRLRRADLRVPISAEPPGATRLAQLWLGTLDRGDSASRCVGEGGSTSIQLSYRRRESREFVHRSLAAATLLALALLTGLGLRRRIFAPLACRWPYLLGVTAGLGWWLWLRPSILGWAVALASLAVSFLWGWKRPRQGGSAIVTLTLSER